MRVTSLPHDVELDVWVSGVHGSVVKVVFVTNSARLSLRSSPLSGPPLTATLSPSRFDQRFDRSWGRVPEARHVTRIPYSGTPSL